jgi:hypothetical protein
MIKQPEWGTRDVNKYFYEAEMKSLVWLAGWEDSTVRNIVSAIRKAISSKVG